MTKSDITVSVNLSNFARLMMLQCDLQRLITLRDAHRVCLEEYNAHYVAAEVRNIADEMAAICKKIRLIAEGEDAHSNE